MSDARWMEIGDDVSAAVRHFSMAASLHAAGGFGEQGLPGYKTNMAFMHAMQSGHASLEKGLIRILDLLDEDRPTGHAWRSDLIRRVARSVPGRPAILPADIAMAAETTHAFSDVAAFRYDSFTMDCAGPAINAARYLADSLEGAIASFRNLVDPPEAETDGRPDHAGQFIS